MKHIEIERKYLVRIDQWNTFGKPEGVSIRQGYLCTDVTKVIRIRIYGNKGFLTIKGRMQNLGRPEFEYPIPIDEAADLLLLSGGFLIEKTRYKVSIEGKIWDVDVFYGMNAGLYLAEIELNSPEERIDLPGWVGTEVTDDARYYNAYLSQHPYSSWR